MNKTFILTLLAKIRLAKNPDVVIYYVSYLQGRIKYDHYLPNGRGTGMSWSKKEWRC